MFVRDFDGKQFGQFTCALSAKVHRGESWQIRLKQDRTAANGTPWHEHHTSHKRFLQI